MPEHRGLGLDAADAPADHADAVDHRGVRIGADQGVREHHVARPADPAEQVLEIDLMDDADAGRHDLQALEGLHAPFQEGIAFAIALELERDVPAQGVGRAIVVHLYRVIDDQVDWNGGFDQPAVAPETPRTRAHRRQVAQQRHPCEILQDDAGDDERQLVDALGCRRPGGKPAHVVFMNPFAIAIAQQ